MASIASSVIEVPSGSFGRVIRVVGHGREEAVDDPLGLGEREVVEERQPEQPAADVVGDGALARPRGEPSAAVELCNGT